VEHDHRCLYCDLTWFCHEDCPVVGPSVCDRCRERLRTSDTPRRVIALRAGSPALDRLTQHAAERIRDLLRRPRSR
jgi:hypothetical protein